MFYLNDQKYVKVWSIEDKGNYVKGKVSTSEKKQDGTYENTNWFVTFVSKAADIARGLGEGDVITVKGGKISNPYSKQHSKAFLNVTFWDIEVTEKKSNGTQKPAGNFQAFDDDFDEFKIDDSDQLPF